jgi:integrase
MRHWCAVARLIETKIETGRYDVFTVKYWLGHEEQDTTDNYIHFAEQYYNQYPKSWIHDALRSHNFVRGQHQGKTRVWQNKATLLSFPSRNDYGPAEGQIS